MMMMVMMMMYLESGCSAFRCFHGFSCLGGPGGFELMFTPTQSTSEVVNETKDLWKLEGACWWVCCTSVCTLCVCSSMHHVWRIRSLDYVRRDSHLLSLASTWRHCNNLQWSAMLMQFSAKTFKTTESLWLECFVFIFPHGRRWEDSAKGASQYRPKFWMHLCNVVNPRITKSDYCQKWVVTIVPKWYLQVYSSVSDMFDLSNFHVV